MPRPAAKRARVTRSNQPPAQTAKAKATRGRPKRKVSGGESEEPTTSAKSVPKSRVTSRQDASSSDVEGRSDEIQDESSGLVRRERERDSFGSQTPVRDRQQVNAPLSGGVGMGTSLRLQGFPGSARRDMNPRGHTPAFESSILNAFRPRPRQPSILQLVGDDSLDLGSSELGSDDLLGSFDPEDVSTPLPAKRRKSLNQADMTPTVTKKTPKLPELFVEVPVRHDLASDNRISDEPPALVQALGDQQVDEAPEEPEVIDNPQEQEPALDEALSEIHVAADVDDNGDGRSSVRSVDSLPPMNFAIETTPQRRRQTITMAPPESSVGSITPPASTPESTANQKPSPQFSKPTHLSTTSLQDALLPRRHRRGKGLASKRNKSFRAGGKDYVLSAPGSEDELNYTGGQQEDTSAGRQRNTKRSQQDQARFKLREKAQNTSQLRRGRSKAATVSSQPRKSSTPKKTYSRLSTTGGDADWDKENQLDEETEISPEREIIAPVMSEELLLQKKKFAEIDEWSIDFEEVLDDDGEVY
ncbi:hypothetical protein H112_08111 [Trichophyton rubrum D6]|uniref:Uncharacterized protein n=3 Tax=Trichophyton rubrum TaxID=5551 RepID=A0A178EV68_TRIRU|nr:uncharacterized protein TERG_00687 [Trichophyton rubrum CBS 118892]EZF10666.1 hypothetical protein H100_08139 [Trichophyton rubrum MR850]EZF37505.1 hypothetical protein H102_08095 [Trichophyton rubrum CBS 100081]EZF48199.1 hypothetical protein H103_08123 [Trichophyton rubrum CBS 288.86]EZF58796.1 hypothetical protein H104_08070 [Trichophyton rubrum CBS 289.86]EZF80107.1 hypothetical protein H110_08124 [Trichophyton rubrum MR1448]EZF90715.1 hypothetical protein H113_08186 [Trichophyton rubr